MSEDHSSRIRFFTFFLKSKKRDFLRFFEAAFKKNVKNVIQNSKFQTLLTFYRAMHFSANARYWERMSSVRPSVCLCVRL